MALGRLRERRQTGAAGPTAAAGGQAAQSLNRPRLILFGLPEYAVFLAAVPVGLYLPLVYAKDFGLSLTQVGMILMFARISDVVTDPLIGWLSDRTRGPMGRRKPWMLGGAVLLMLSAYQLFNPPAGVSATYLLIWAVGLWLGWTMINIPYYAWGAELSDSYHERTRITGYRQALGFLGNVSVLAAPTLMQSATGYGGLPREGLTIIGAMLLVALPVAITLALVGVRERPGMTLARSSLWRHLGKMRRNGSFRLLFYGFLLQSLGTGWGSATFMLFATYVVGAEHRTQAILLGYYGFNLLSLPLWLAISHRIGKRPAWVTGGVMFVFVTPLFLLLGNGDLGWFFAILALYGIAGGNFNAISLSMKADVIEVASRRHSENVAGSYIAVWSLGQKLMNALPLGIALPALEWLGFSPSGDNTDAAIRLLAWMYVLPPWCFYALAVVAIWRYPISAERLARLRTRFDRRDASRVARAASQTSGQPAG